MRFFPTELCQYIIFCPPEALYIETSKKIIARKQGFAQKPCCLKNAKSVLSVRF